MIGFKGPIHHGWKMAKINKSGRPLNVYPEGSSAWEDFELGVRRFQRNEPWDGAPRRKRRDDAVSSKSY